MSNTWKISGKLIRDIDNARMALSDVAQDLQAAWDDKPESWQEGEIGVSVQDWIDTLIDAEEMISSAIEDLSEVPE